MTAIVNRVPARICTIRHKHRQCCENAKARDKRAPMTMAVTSGSSNCATGHRRMVPSMAADSSTCAAGSALTNGANASDVMPSWWPRSTALVEKSTIDQMRM